MREVVNANLTSYVHLTEEMSLVWDLGGFNGAQGFSTTSMLRLNTLRDQPLALLVAAQARQGKGDVQWSNQHNSRLTTVPTALSNGLLVNDAPRTFTGTMHPRVHGSSMFSLIKIIQPGQ